MQLAEQYPTRPTLILFYFWLLIQTIAFLSDACVSFQVTSRFKKRLYLFVRCSNDDYLRNTAQLHEK